MNPPLVLFFTVFFQKRAQVNALRAKFKIFAPSGPPRLPRTPPMLLWHTLGTYFRLRHGRRIQKIPLDAGSTCPNRDGTLARTGCIFCNDRGSGSGMAGLDFAAQWAYWREKYVRTDADRGFMAYIQSFSNTYGPARRLHALLAHVSALPDCLGLSIGTRPDCLDAGKLDMLAALPLPEVWLELGLQTVHDATLARINRHHSARQGEDTVREAAARGLKVCVHLMAGLPGEDERHFQESVLWAASLPVAGIKLHNVYICRDTELARWYGDGRYAPISRDEYVDMLCAALPVIPSRMVMHRLTGDPAPGELLAPAWAAEKRPLLTDVHRALAARRLWQGCQAAGPGACPAWDGR